MYEICNEPNGADVTWKSNIKPYAEYVIPAIREGDSNGVIIVGSGDWSQDIQDPAADPLKYENIIYSVHFYAGTHTQGLRNMISDALHHIPIFCTEWGTSDSSGNNGPFLEEAQTWMDFLNSRKISWCNWALCDKPAPPFPFKPGAGTSGDWNDETLTPSGRFVRDAMTNR